MKKFSVLALTFVLIAALFTGCRTNPDTTGSTPAATTGAAPTTKPAATKPDSTTRPDGTGVLPDMTGSNGGSGAGAGNGGANGASSTDITRGHRGPRY